MACRLMMALVLAGGRAIVFGHQLVEGAEAIWHGTGRKNKEQWRMFKKLFVLILVAGAVAIACLPWWTTRLAEQAFAQPEAPVADEMLHKAIRIKVLMLSHADAGKLAEKGTIYFPESPHLPTFLFIAAKSAEKAGNAEGAVHWYRRFLAAYPQHEWASQASGYLEKIKGMHDIE